MVSKEDQALIARYLPKLAEHDYSKWLTNGCYLDAAAAARVVEFAHEELVQTMGQWAGQKVQLLDWEIYELIVPLFGIKRANGKRRFTVAYIRIPRKNGKSTLASLLILYLLACDGEARPFVYGYAVDEKQAKICLNEAIAYVDASAYLKYDVFITYKDKIECRLNGGKYEVLSKGAENKDGLNAHAAVCDEMHQIKDGGAVIDRVHRSSSTRSEPLEIFITTAGLYSPGKETICWKYDQKAMRVKKNPDYDPDFFPLLYGAEDEDDISDPAVWKKANPSLGIIKSYEYMEKESREALRDPSKLNDFKRFELNIWTGTQSAWIQPASWRARIRPFSQEAFRGRPCYAALDLSKVRDYTSLTLCFPPFELDKDYMLKTFLWLPEKTIEERAKTQIILPKWVKDGWIIPTEGDVVDYDAVLIQIELVRQLFRVHEIAFDPWNSSMLVQQLLKCGAPMVEFRQGFKSLSGPTKDFDLALGEGGNLWHEGNPVIEWMLSNVVLTKDAALNWKPDKSKSGDAIDGIVSKIMAYGRAWANRKQDPLEERGIRSLND